MAFTVGTPHSTAGAAVPQDRDPMPGDGFDPGQILGSFLGRLVRPRPSRKGLTAQVLGENGPDADIITSLHLSKYLDVPVNVQMVFIKNSEGQVLKKGDEYPRLKPFVATIKRPTSHADGLIAQFFAENGSDADIVSELNFTRYLDNLVYVTISKASGASVPIAIAGEDLDEAARHLTPAEEKKLKNQQRLAHEAWRQLIHSGFFRKDAVLRVLGTTETFAQWVATQPCRHPGDAPCGQADIVAFLIPNPGLRFRHVPFCHDHARLWESGQVTLPNSASAESFLTGELAQLVHKWAQVRLREMLHTPAGHDPTPSVIYRFAVEHHLLGALPQGFTAFFEG